MSFGLNNDAQLSKNCSEKISDSKRIKLLSLRTRRLRLTFWMRLRSQYFMFPPFRPCSEPIELIKFVGASIMSHGIGALTRKFHNETCHDINAGGEIHIYAELYRFGFWLLIDGSPGINPVPGKAADPIIIFKTIGAAAAEFLAHERHLIKEQGLTETAAYRRLVEETGLMARSKMRDRWFIMYGEELDAAVFKPRLKSSARFLAAYLAQLGELPDKPGKLIRVRSILLEKVLTLITGGSKST